MKRPEHKDIQNRSSLDGRILVLFPSTNQLPTINLSWNAGRVQTTYEHHKKKGCCRPSGRNHQKPCSNIEASPIQPDVAASRCRPGRMEWAGARHPHLKDWLGRDDFLKPQLDHHPKLAFGSVLTKARGLANETMKWAA